MSTKTSYPPIPPNQPYAAPAPAPEPPLPPLVDLEGRRAVLQDAIAVRVRKGYRVVSQTDTTAQFVKPKTFNVAFAFLWFLVLGVGVFVYLAYYAAKRDRQHYLRVDERGQVVMTFPR